MKVVDRVDGMVILVDEDLVTCEKTVSLVVWQGEFIFRACQTD